MGRDKAGLVVGGRRLADRAATVLRLVCDPVIEVGPGHTGLPHVREDPAGAGPLAALWAGWEELRRAGLDAPVLVLAVDMPRVHAPLLRLLAERPGPATAVPVAGGVPQPLCARYGADALDAAGRLLAAGERSFRALLESVDVGWIEKEEWQRAGGPDTFTDVDTPDDVARLFPGSSKGLFPGT